jgi:hypothetical protein
MTGGSDKWTGTLTVIKIEEKKDTKLTCYDKSMVLGEKVTLEAKLQEKAFPYVDIKNAYVDLYIAGEWRCKALTDINGKASCNVPLPAKITSAGTYTIKAVFTATGDYNGSECTSTLTVTVKPECNEGVIVTVKDVPIEGLKVQYDHPGVFGCPWLPPDGEKVINQTDPVAVFSGIRTILPYGDKVCVRVVNMAGDVMSVTEPLTIPTTGCRSVTMYGYQGCKFRTRITTEPTYPAPGKSFTLKANLIINPAEPATEGMEVEFFKLVDKTEESLGRNLTDEDGIAVLSHAEPEAGTYKYIARYTGGNTYAEIKTVTVTEVPPVCPIFTSTAGTIVFTQLDTLRWFRDNKMPRFLSKAYYKVVPVTGRIASYSSSARFIIRNIAKVSIWAIQKRYSHVIKDDQRFGYMG